MTVKLLRYPQSESQQDTYGRKKYKNTPQILREKLAQGYSARIVLKGMWYDQNYYFEGEGHPALKQDEEWLCHAYLPWHKIMIWFDDDGCHVEFKYKLHLGVGSWLYNGGHQEVNALFRLDALKLKAGEDVSQVFQGEVLTRNVLFAVRLRLDECKLGKSSHAVCSLEFRPISMTQIDKYLKPASEGSGNGAAWFTFMGEKGSLELELQKVHGGNYLAAPASPGSSECWGQQPCPFITHESFEVQILPKIVILQQRAQGLGDDQTPWFLYPIYDDAAMSAGGADTSNLDRIDTNRGSVELEINRKGPESLLSLPDETDREETAGTKSNYSAKDEATIAGLQKKINDMQGKLDEAHNELKGKSDEVEELRSKVIGEARKAGPVASAKHIQLTPGESVVVQSSSSRGASPTLPSSESNSGVSD